MSDNRLLTNVMICLLLLLSVQIFLWTKDMTPGAELFPRIMAGGLAFFGLIELILTNMRMSQAEKRPVEKTTTVLFRKSAAYMGLFFLLVLAFFVVLPFIGFEISAVVFMLVAMMLLGGKPALRKWPVAILVPALLLLVFRVGLDVQLPTILPF